ncbi:hypothetical protein VUR80DRAFT_2252 [Thermomyces stellatus]
MTRGPLDPRARHSARGIPAPLASRHTAPLLPYCCPRGLAWMLSLQFRPRRRQICACREKRRDKPPDAPIISTSTANTMLPLGGRSLRRSL